jgi:hypothetical protein
MPLAPCRLCGETKELQESHIVPKFVFRWMKETSSTGYIRHSQQPNLRVQDGLKFYLLCGDCERRLNQWETQFANHIFHPLTQGTTDTALYGPWFLLFCVSVSWRVLVFYIDNDYIERVPAALRPDVHRAERAWREFLLGCLPRPGRHEQHFVPLGTIRNCTYSDIPTNINRYFLRVIDMDIANNGNTAFVYTKIGPFVILGFIAIPFAKQWHGAKVCAGHGRIRPRAYTMPKIFAEYLFTKARKAARMKENISAAQQMKIRAAYMNDLDQAAHSDFMEAMHQDVRLFGYSAFTPPKPDTE